MHLESEIMAEWNSDAEEFAQLIKHPENQELVQFESTMSSHEAFKNEDLSPSVSGRVVHWIR